MANIIGGVTTTPLAIKTIKQKVTDKVSNALKGTKSGEIVTIDNISPLEHNITVNVEGANFVTRRGKNQLSYPYSYSNKSPFHTEGITFIDNGDGSITANGATTGYSTFIFCGDSSGAKKEEFERFLIDGETYTISLSGAKGFKIIGEVHNKDGSLAYYINDTNMCTFTVDKSKYDYYYLRVFANDTSLTFDNAIIRPQIEIGNIVTEFEPYIEPITYPVNADGTVEGVKSAYPTTVLTADTEGAIITAEYNKDINKTLGNLETLLGGI